MTGYIAGRTRILVFEPDPAQVVIALEDRKWNAGGGEVDRCAQPGDTRADDHSQIAVWNIQPGQCGTRYCRQLQPGSGLRKPRCVGIQAQLMADHGRVSGRNVFSQ